MKITFNFRIFGTLLYLMLMVVSGEYEIKDGEIPSYLHYSLRNVEKEIFPREIKIKLSLSRIEGTLLYTIDKKDNQLIVTLYEDPEERMKIEMRGEEYYVTLRELCGCDKCRYKMLELTFGVTDQYMNASCNDHGSIKWKVNENKLINKAYPMMSKGDSHEALLWLVNTSPHEEYFPNNVQISGCIFDVIYNGKSINMSIFGGIQHKCRRSCTRNICNYGVCYETFRHTPFCDCTNSFMNGAYCNSTGLRVANHRIKSFNQNFKFKIVKIMWRSNSTEIFHIKNEQITINITAKKKELSLSYKHGQTTTIRCFITDNYDDSANSSLIIKFQPNIISIKYFTENTSITGNIPTSVDLSEVYFTKMELLNGDGTIDVVYKSDNSQYGWINVDLKYYKLSSDIDIIKRKQKRNKYKNDWKEFGFKFELSPINIPKSDSLIKSKYEKTNLTSQWKMITIIIMSVLLFVNFLLLGITIKCLKKHKRDEAI